MSNSSTALRQIFNDARPLVEKALDLSDKFKGFRELATANGLDWSQIKALLKAQIQDEREDDGKNRVGRIIEKADFATAYADMLGLGTAKMNEKNFSGKVRLTVTIDDEVARRLGVDPDPPHDPTIGEIIDDVPATGPATAPAPGAGGDTITAKDDAGEINAASVAARLDASSTNPAPVQGVASEEGADAIVLDAPSSQLNPEAKATEVEPGNAGGIEVPVRLNNDREGVASRLAGGRTPAGEGAELKGVDAPSHVSNPAAGAAEQGLGTAHNSMPGPDLSSSVALALPVVTDAPVEQSPSHDIAPGAPIPGPFTVHRRSEPIEHFERDVR